jgi:signal transduction histidine kinase
MIGSVRRESVIRGTAIGVLGAVVVSEALDAGSVPGAVGLLLCGMFAVAMALAPDTRRVLPVAVAAGASALFSVVCAALPVRPEHTFGLAELVALGWLAVRTTRRRSPLPAIVLSGALVIVAGLLPLRLDDHTDLGTKAFIGTVLVFGQALATLLGVCLRLRDRLRARERAEIRRAQRLEHARDLHDFVAHHVTAIVAQTRAVRFTTTAGQPPPPEALDAMLAGIEQAGSEALESMRGVIAVLRTGADTAMSARSQRTLAEVVTEATAQFAAVGPPTTATLDERLTNQHLPAPVIDVAHHVVREALTNVLRHAGEVTRVEVGAHVCRDDPQRVRITVTDDGRGAAESLLAGGGFGLVGLAERVTAAGGQFTAGRAERGWRVTALLPTTAVPVLPSSTP